MKNILFLSASMPFPPIGGEKIRPFHFIKHLSAMGYKITIAAFTGSKSVSDSGSQFANVKMIGIKLPKYISYLQCAGGLLRDLPLENSYFYSGRMKRAIEQELKIGNYDLIFCHLVRMAEYVKNYRGILKVLDMSDALSYRYGLSCRYRKWPFNMIESLESKRLKKFEPIFASSFDLNLISSSVDKEYLEKELGISRLSLVENGIDEEALVKGQGKFDNNKIVFFANMRTFHNVDAAIYFYKAIFPLIKKHNKDARFVIAGANMPFVLRKLSGVDNSVQVYNNVEDIYALIKDSCVSVAPMRVAVGIQNKIIQSMAAGVPVVATRLGLGGIQANEGREILLADNPEDFSEKVITLMQDHKLRSEIAASALSLIRDKYLWTGIVRGLEQKLLTLNN
ncbi:MAG: glycosyltransferase [Candidatus Omnitrophota bacterium]|jgi:glycosyltransferase involved in cell wall biosynthesis|nr:MAG: glycosyltransferase [Candidatus Omnitrophota bacterium]